MSLMEKLEMLGWALIIVSGIGIGVVGTILAVEWIGRAWHER